MIVEEAPYTFLTLKSGDNGLDCLWFCKQMFQCKEIPPDQQIKILQYLMDEAKAKLAQGVKP